MITTIIPSYRNPDCLKICLQSLVDNSRKDTEIICIIDGYHLESQNIVELFKNKVRFIINKNNLGMQQSINIGVYNSKNPWVFIANDDNVFPPDWDSIVLSDVQEDTIITVNQIEPSAVGMFGFIYCDFGGIDNFEYDDFMNNEINFREDKISDQGRIFPFLIDKKLFMSVGGFDISYPSPFVCDCDFFLKLECLNYTKFIRTHKVNLYHFGSIATRHNKNEIDAQKFINSEELAKRIFFLKWGFEINKDNKSVNNSYKPNHSINGIKY